MDLYESDLSVTIRLVCARFIAHCSRSGRAARQLTQLELRRDQGISRRSDFGEFLVRKDRHRPVNRIFLMGCGRSGTWLAYSLLSMAEDAYVAFEEVDVGRFARIRSLKPHHILKRYAKSFETAHLIPASIGILWMVRHPFDVLTSHNPAKGKRRFHIQPERWNCEMDALRIFVEHPRPNGMVLRYEDLVSDPERTVSQIAAKFDLAISNPDQFVTNAPIPPNVSRAMHGVRPIRTNSVDRWRSDPDLDVYLDEIMPLIQRRLEWLGEVFHYDITHGRNSM
jgi:hypothetical protein